MCAQAKTEPRDHGATTAQAQGVRRRAAVSAGRLAPYCIKISSSIKGDIDLGQVPWLDLCRHSTTKPRFGARNFQAECRIHNVLFAALLRRQTTADRLASRSGAHNAGVHPRLVLVSSRIFGSSQSAKRRPARGLAGREEARAYLAKWTQAMAATFSEPFAALAARLTDDRARRLLAHFGTPLAVEPWGKSADKRAGQDRDVGDDVRS